MAPQTHNKSSRGDNGDDHHRCGGDDQPQPQPSSKEFHSQLAIRNEALIEELSEAHATIEELQEKIQTLQQVGILGVMARVTYNSPSPSSPFRLVAAQVRRSSTASPPPSSTPTPLPRSRSRMSPTRRSSSSSSASTGTGASPETRTTTTRTSREETGELYLMSGLMRLPPLPI